MNAGDSPVVPPGDVHRSLRMRETVTRADIGRVREIVSSTGFFHDHEIGIACELVEEAIVKGPVEGYRFLFADAADSRGAIRTVGYTSYGQTPCTEGTFDLYWIAVHNDFRSHGIGRLLHRETESRIRALGGRRLFAETSGRDQYAPTRRFYVSLGYAEEARLADFYAPGDDKVVYGVRL
jgi:ribosomal protein S18 acetylase RimI-like enzyme